MSKTGLINKISSQDRGSTTQNMQVLDQQSKAYFNFINSLKSESTRKSYTYCIEKGDPSQIVNLCWDIYQRNNWMNTFFFIGGSNRAMVNLLKIKWQESLSWETKQSFGPNTRIRPVNFSMEHKNMLSNLHAVVSKGYLAIDEKHMINLSPV